VASTVLRARRDRCGNVWRSLRALASFAMARRSDIRHRLWNSTSFTVAKWLPSSMLQQAPAAEQAAATLLALLERRRLALALRARGGGEAAAREPSGHALSVHEGRQGIDRQEQWDLARQSQREDHKRRGKEDDVHADHDGPLLPRVATKQCPCEGE